MTTAGAVANAADWKYEFTPYVFGAAMKGDMGTRGVTTNLDASFSDLTNYLDAGFMGMFTASTGRWTFGVDATYMKLSDMKSKSVTGPFGYVGVSGAMNVQSSMTVLQPSAAYRVVDERAKLDLVGGLRYTNMQADFAVNIATTPAIVFNDGGTVAGGRDSWTDAIVGLRVLFPLSPQWTLVGYGDAGGGNGSTSYQALAGVNWHFSKDWTAKAGYRALKWDYDNNGNIWNVKASGFYLGTGYAF